jgi:hypothetical protein
MDPPVVPALNPLPPLSAPLPPKRVLDCANASAGTAAPPSHTMIAINLNDQNRDGIVLS